VPSRISWYVSKAAAAAYYHTDKDSNFILGKGGTVTFYHWSVKLHATKTLVGVHAKLHTFLTSPGDSSKAPYEPVVKIKFSVLVGILIPVV